MNDRDAFGARRNEYYSLGLLACLPSFFPRALLPLSLSLFIAICVVRGGNDMLRLNGGCPGGSAASDRGSKVGCGRDWKQVECLLGYLHEGKARKDR